MLENKDIFTKKFHIDLNKSIRQGIFPGNLKLADVTPVYKKGDRFDKSNYRPISTLPAASKIFERLLLKQINNFMDPILSVYQCGFRKNMSAQNCLLYMVEKWKRCLDNKGSCGVLLTDLSKAFDCLKHDLLIAKLNAYGFDHKALKLIYSYLTKRFQRVKVNSSYSSWFEILFGVPQGSILGPNLFNIDLIDLFLFCIESFMANYADDNSPFVCDDDYLSVNAKLTKDSEILLDWFANNWFRANPDKFHFVSSAFNAENVLTIQNYKITSTKCEKLLGVKIDFELSFDDHVSSLCKKASNKLHALARISYLMSIEQRSKIMKAFIYSQFGYCPLVWMFHSRKLNNRINNIHERALRIVYGDHSSTFQTLLQKDKSVTIHTRNIQTLGIELYKIFNNLAPQIMHEILPLRTNLRYPTRAVFESRNIHTVSYGIRSLAHLGPKIWDIIPQSIKDCTSLQDFKSKIKKWTPNECPCKLCIPYIKDLGFLK